MTARLPAPLRYEADSQPSSLALARACGAQAAGALVRRIAEGLAERGAPRAALLAAAGIPPGALDLAWLPWGAVEALFAAGEALSGDDRAGFRLPRARDVEALGLPGALLFASPTLGEGLRRLIEAQRLLSDAWRIGLEGSSTLTFALLQPESRAAAHAREQLLADLLAATRQAVGAPISPVEVRFSHAREGDLAEYEAFFGCPVRFGAGATELRLAEEDLRRPLATANPLFAQLFAQQAAAQLARLPRRLTWAERLRALLEEDLDALRLAEITLETAASRLRASPRTLQRALGREGTSFARELEALRREQAEALLRARVEIGEISWRLGYAEPAVFHRAFKRWTGLTPAAFRRSQRRSPPRLAPGA